MGNKMKNKTKPNNWAYWELCKKICGDNFIVNASCIEYCVEEENANEECIKKCCNDQSVHSDLLEMTMTH